MIVETRLNSGFWRYSGDGHIENLGESADGRYTHQIHHCGWVEMPYRLSDADIAKLFEGESLLTRH